MGEGRTQGRVAIATALAWVVLAAPAVASPAASLVEDINPSGSSDPVGITDVGGTAFFGASADGLDPKLWKSDGGSATFVFDVFPEQLTNVNGTLFFDGEGDLWKSDAGGTQVVDPIDPNLLTASGGTLFFVASNGTDGVELWKSSGSSAAMVEDINTTGSSNPFALTDVGGTLYFIADDASGPKLWKSDGTGADKVDNTANAVGEVTNVSGTVFFTASDAAHGVEVWKSTGSGAARVTDIDPGVDGSNPHELTNVGGSLFFEADDGTGPALWKSDGTGAQQVAPVNPDELTSSGGKLFFSADDGTHGSELWKSDGTSAAMVRDISPTGGSFPQFLTNVGGTLYFAASDDDHGNELWASDGTGAAMVRDINPGADSSSPAELAAVGGTLFFSATDGPNGFELWKAQQAPTTTTVSSSANPAAAGQAVTFTATVSGQATGSVTFSIDDVAQSPVALSAGVATLTVTLAAGQHTVIASFRGDPGFADSKSTALTQTVNAPAGSGPGPGGGGTLPPPDTTAPVLSSVSLSATVFAVSRGTRFRYSLSEPARVLVTIKRARPGRRVSGRCVKPTRRNRSAPKCTRYTLVGRFAIESQAGTNSHRFSGRIGITTLRPGRYRAILLATDAAGNRSTSVRRAFRVVRG